MFEKKYLYERISSSWLHEFNFMVNEVIPKLIIGIEAEYFRSKQELLNKIKFYLNCDKCRNKLASNGRKKLLMSGHEALDRCKQVLKYMDT
jgi:spore maturation protein CgeB